MFGVLGPNPVIPPRQKQNSPPAIIKPLGLAGKASGKRTLAEVMDYDIERKKKTRKSSSPMRSTQSKFFSKVDSRSGSVQRRHSDILPIAGPSRLQSEDKENRSFVVDDEEAETSEPDLDGSELSLKAQFGTDVNMEDVNADDFPDVVEQEDGYISPSPLCSKDIQDLSSPPQAGRSPRPRNRNDDLEMAPTGMIISDIEDEDEASFGAEAISSPISVRRPSNHRRQAYQTPSRWRNGGQEQLDNILVGPTPTPSKPKEGIDPDLDDVPSPILYRGPDLRRMLGDDGSTELSVDERPNESRSASNSASPPSPSPETPNFADEQAPKVIIDIDNFEDLADEEEQRVREISTRANTVMNGWRDRWALPPKKVQTPLVGKRKASPQQLPCVSPTKSKKPFTPGARPSHAFNLRRNETNVTPAGRHSLAHGSKHLRSAPAKFVVGGSMKSNSPAMRSTVRPKRSFLLFETVNRTTTTTSTSRERQVVDLTMVDSVQSVDLISSKNSKPSGLESEVTSVAQARFAQFRLVYLFFAFFLVSLADNCLIISLAVPDQFQRKPGDFGTAHLIRVLILIGNFKLNIALGAIVIAFIYHRIV